jgi:hypothetical protein
MTCKFCQKDGLHWVETSFGWRLFETKKIQHNCLKKKSPTSPKTNFKINFRNDPKINKALAIFKQQLKLSKQRRFRA